MNNAQTLAIAAGSTAFYKSRRDAGFTVADLARAGSDIWIRMFLNEPAYEELGQTQPLYAGDDSGVPAQAQFVRLEDPTNWGLAAEA